MTRTLQRRWTLLCRVSRFGSATAFLVAGSSLLLFLDVAMAPACGFLYYIRSCSSAGAALQPMQRDLRRSHSAPHRAARQHPGVRPTQREMPLASCTSPCCQARTLCKHHSSTYVFILLSSPRCREDIELLNGILPDWESKGLSVTLARPVYELFLERHTKGSLSTMCRPAQVLAEHALPHHRHALCLRGRLWPYLGADRPAAHPPAGDTASLPFVCCCKVFVAPQSHARWLHMPWAMHPWAHVPRRCWPRGRPGCR